MLQNLVLLASWRECHEAQLERIFLDAGTHFSTKVHGWNLPLRPELLSLYLKKTIRVDDLSFFPGLGILIHRKRQKLLLISIHPQKQKDIYPKPPIWLICSMPSSAAFHLYKTKKLLINRFGSFRQKSDCPETAKKCINLYRSPCSNPCLFLQKHQLDSYIKVSIQSLLLHGRSATEKSLIVFLSQNPDCPKMPEREFTFDIYRYFRP